MMLRDIFSIATKWNLYIGSVWLFPEFGDIVLLLEINIEIRDAIDIRSTSLPSVWTRQIDWMEHHKTLQTSKHKLDGI